MRIVIRPLLPAAVALVALAACSPEREPVELPTAEGPSRFQTEVALRHAAQFEESELADRPAGSQQEQGAAVYILGVLQRNGYVVRLDGVPVGNLVTSTNVVARRARDEAPDVIVVAAYDTAPGGAGDGKALGLFLELSRAVNAAAPARSVWFAALGAERVEEPNSHLGSRRLADALDDDDVDPLVVRLGEISDDGPIRVAGEAGEHLAAVVPDGSVRPGPADATDVFSEQGLGVAVISGGLSEVGAALFRYLVHSED